MGAPYSLDLRERVVAAVAGGMSRAEAARRFEVSHSSSIRWTQRATATGSPAALPMKEAVRAGRGGVDTRPAGREARHHRSRIAGGADPARRHGQLLRRVAFPRPHRSQLQKACAPANRIAPTWPDGAGSGNNDKAKSLRIASPEMLPWADPLPHLICSPPSIIGGGGDGVDQHGDTRRAGGCAGRTVRFWQPEGTRTDPGRIRRCEWLASQARDASAPRRAGQSAVRPSAGASLI